jgi:single-strand DNA-binding protein
MLEVVAERITFLSSGQKNDPELKDLEEKWHLFN